MDARSAYALLVQLIKEAAVLASCADVLGWDERTYLPPAGGDHRAEQLALLARLVHQRLTDNQIGELLAVLEGSELVEGDTLEAANLREIRRSFNRATKLPSRLVEELARVTTQAQQVWQQARKDNDFQAFCPWLEKIVALKREEAHAVGFGSGVPYDALLDEYEPGATSADIVGVFAQLKARLVPLVAAITSSSRQPLRDILQREYPTDRQEIFGREAAERIGFNFQAGRLDTTTHPFCSGIGPGDCRITTRYNPRFFSESFFGILHEAGHGLYEQGLDPEQYGTPTGSYCSLGIHESQSRLWENQVGRDLPFWQHFYPQAQALFPVALGDVPLADFHFAINDVHPSFIRVEADEATYNLHVLLRFELEQALISGDLTPADVPAAWNEKFEQLLGLQVPDDAHGCLQDIHWSGGGIGYFPTYTLGNLYAAQFMEQARRDIPDLANQLRHGEFVALKEWLVQKIHRLGRRYSATELCRRITGEPLSSEPLMTYLERKYAPLYGL